MISSELMRRFQTLKRLRAKVQAAEQMSKDVTVMPAQRKAIASQLPGPRPRYRPLEGRR